MTLGAVTLLAPVTVTVPAGGTLVVRGANGSGKSTLLRVLAGLHVPSTGTVSVAGAAPAPRSRAFRRAVGGTVAAPVAARDLTLAEHVALVATTWGTPVAAARREAADLLGALGLGALVDRFWHELSSGQTQLATLAIALARPAEVLLLDEPEQRLDADRVTTVARLLVGRREAGATLVVATHSDALAEALGGPVLTLVGSPEAGAGNSTADAADAGDADTDADADAAETPGADRDARTGRGAPGLA